MLKLYNETFINGVYIHANDENAADDDVSHHDDPVEYVSLNSLVELELKRSPRECQVS